VAGFSLFMLEHRTKWRSLLNTKIVTYVANPLFDETHLVAVRIALGICRDTLISFRVKYLLFCAILYSINLHWHILVKLHSKYHRIFLIIFKLFHAGRQAEKEAQLAGNFCSSLTCLVLLRNASFYIFQIRNTHYKFGKMHDEECNLSSYQNC
jgi:hypothetical protein